jgi:DNA-binding XRE family transcriptional regulator
VSINIVYYYICQGQKPCFRKRGCILRAMARKTKKTDMATMVLPGQETLGRRIARLRKERGYTQVELAEKIGIIQVLISDYEREPAMIPVKKKTINSEIEISKIISSILP